MRFEKFPTGVSLNRFTRTNGKRIFGSHLELKISNSSLALGVVRGHSGANQLALTGFFSEDKMLPTILQAILITRFSYFVLLHLQLTVHCALTNALFQS